MKPLHTLLIFCLLPLSLYSQDDQMGILVKHLNKQPELFETISIPDSEKPTHFQITLGKKPLILPSGDEFDGFRFKAPKNLENKHFTWYFNVPNEWSHWYIHSVNEPTKPAFKNWLNADKVYTNYDDPDQKNRTRVLQTLKGDYFTPGKEYILWFRRVTTGGDNLLKGRFKFQELKQPDDYKELEKSLALTPLPDEAQAKALNSRGAKILLDKEFFSPSYASGRIDSVFFSLRQTTRMRNGFFITSSISVPACDTTPSYHALRKKHGEADFIQTSTELRAVRLHAGGDLNEKKDPNTTTYYYDFFGFVINNDDEKKTVQNVVTHASNFSQPKDKKASLSYRNVPMRNLTIFHNENQEVGRLFYFNEGEKEPLCIVEPPIGKYKMDDMTMEYLGDGSWLWLTYFQDGSVARKIAFRNHRMNGKAIGYHANGKPSFTANYKDGLLHGDVTQYAENGDITKKAVFENGKKKLDLKPSKKST